MVVFFSKWQNYFLEKIPLNLKILLRTPKMLSAHIKCARTSLWEALHNSFGSVFEVRLATLGCVLRHRVASCDAVVASCDALVVGILLALFEVHLATLWLRFHSFR